MSKLIIYFIAIQLVVMTSFDFSDMFKCLNLLAIVILCSAFFSTKRGKNILKRLVSDFEKA